MLDQSEGSPCDKLRYDEIPIPHAEVSKVASLVETPSYEMESTLLSLPALAVGRALERDLSSWQRAPKARVACDWHCSEGSLRLLALAA